MRRSVAGVFLSITLASATLIAALPNHAFAQMAPAVTTAPVEPPNVQTASGPDLETVVISGRYPGPGLWKIRKGDHVLWILGSQSPLPKRMDWDSANVERIIAGSQEVLMPPAVEMDADVGFFRGLTLLPSLFNALKNPDGKTLGEVLPAAQYARWQVLKQRYIGSNRGIEERRPIFAAVELYEKAIAHSGMTDKDLASDVVSRTAKKHRIHVTTPKVTIRIKEPKSALKAFANETINDQECFSKTLDRIESDLGTMILRANAWAEGDIETLRALPYSNQFDACFAAFSSSAVARKEGMLDVEKRLTSLWFDAAEAALAKNASSFAVLPVKELLQAGGYFEAMTAKGYVIEEP
ncbi:MAG: TraB/GumN family protein [Lysobacter sp.]|nr:TraB/GumN family protein [Lysobacter sp.]